MIQEESESDFKLIEDTLLVAFKSKVWVVLSEQREKKLPRYHDQTKLDQMSSGHTYNLLLSKVNNITVIYTSEICSRFPGMIPWITTNKHKIVNNKARIIHNLNFVTVITVARQAFTMMPILLLPFINQY